MQHQINYYGRLYFADALVFKRWNCILIPTGDYVQFELKRANLDKSFGGHLLKGKSHELRMCEPKHNTWKCVQDCSGKNKMAATSGAAGLGGKR